MLITRPFFPQKTNQLKKNDWIYANVIEFNVEFNVKLYTKQNSTTRHVGKGKNIPVSKLTLKEEMLNTHLFLYYMCFQYSLDYRHNCIQTMCYYSFHVHMDLSYNLNHLYDYTCDTLYWILHDMGYKIILIYQMNIS